MKKITSLLLAFTLSISASCRSVQKTIDNSPLTVIVESSSELVKDKELTRIYKEYFPNNKPEISYRPFGNESKTRFFVNPKINLGEEMNYGFNAGFEVRY